VAAYGQGTYSVTDDLRLTLGARYTKDRRKAAKDDIFFPRVASGRQTYSNFSPSFAIEYQALPDVLTYAKVVSGYKSGGYNLRSSSVSDFERGFGEEKLVSYEIGAKSEWFGRTLRVNAAVFRSNYDDIQVDIPLLFNPSQTSTFNAGKARIDGLELDITAVPFEGMLVNLTYGYLDAKFTRVVDPQSGQDLTSIYVLPTAPKNSLSAGLNYTFRPFSFGTLSANLDYSWQDKIFTQGNARVAYGAFIDAYGLLDGRLTLADIPFSQGKLKAALWGRNLTDKEWVADSIGSFRGFVADRIAAYGQPRSYGVDFTVEF